MSQRDGDTGQQAPSWRKKDEQGDDLIAVWKRRPAHSDERLAAEIVEQLERELAEARKMHAEAIYEWAKWEGEAKAARPSIEHRDSPGDQQARSWLEVCETLDQVCPGWRDATKGTGCAKALAAIRSLAVSHALATTSRSFPICKDHQSADWNQPAMPDPCVLCRLFYLEAQESLLEEWQQRAKRAEDAIKEMERPLDAQMARLNATVVRLNEELEGIHALAMNPQDTEPKEGDPYTLALLKSLLRSAIAAPSAEAVKVANEWLPALERDLEQKRSGPLLTRPFITLAKEILRLNGSVDGGAKKP